jgi:hypothetical protein
MYLLYIFPSELHTLMTCCSNFFNLSKKNSVGCAAKTKIGKAKDLSAPQSITLGYTVLLLIVFVVWDLAKLYIFCWRSAYTLFLGKPEGKRSLGRPRRRRVGNIKMDLREIGWDGRDWTDLVQYRDLRRAL